jgi:hypothetical protein
MPRVTLDGRSLKSVDVYVEHRLPVPAAYLLPLHRVKSFRLS